MLETLVEMRDDHAVEGPQGSLLAHEQGGLGPQSVEHAGQLHCDVACAYHSHLVQRIASVLGEMGHLE